MCNVKLMEFDDILSKDLRCLSDKTNEERAVRRYAYNIREKVRMIMEGEP